MGGRHGAQPRPHVRAPERPRGHARHVRRHVPLVRRLVRPPLLLPDHAQLSVLAKKNKEALDSELGGFPLTDARLCKGLTNIKLELFSVDIALTQPIPSESTY